MSEREPAEDRMTKLVETLRQDVALPERLFGQEADIVRQALAGKSVYQIAQDQAMPEAEVWDVLGRVVREVSGRPLEPVETGGLGSDTDPGVTGGYGDTAFGSIGNEPPIPTPGEPDSE
jgi:hypothetical protein